MPVVADPIDLLAEVKSSGLDKHALQWGSYATYSQYRVPFKKTGPYLPKITRALDWGCGNGHFSYFLTRNNIRTTGYSFEEMPAHLRNVALFEHVRAGQDPVALPFPPQSFDAVFSIGVLEHVHEAGGNPEASMKEIERILKPGGLFLCFHLPNRYTWIEFMVRTANRFLGTHLHQHSRLYSYGEFKKLLEGTAFEILESGRYNFLPRNQLNHLPAFMANSRAVARAIDVLDGALGAVLPWFCQNWYFILKKRHAA